MYYAQIDDYYVRDGAVYYHVVGRLDLAPILKHRLNRSEQQAEAVARWELEQHWLEPCGALRELLSQLHGGVRDQQLHLLSHHAPQEEAGACAQHQRFRSCALRASRCGAFGRVRPRAKERSKGRHTVNSGLFFGKRRSFGCAVFSAFPSPQAVHMVNDL